MQAKSALTPLIQVVNDYETCTIVRIKPNKAFELVKLGYFSGRESQFRLYKIHWLGSPDERPPKPQPQARVCDVWENASGGASFTRNMTDSGVLAILCSSVYDDFGVSPWYGDEPKGEAVKCLCSDADYTKASVKVGGLFQINIEHLVDRSTFKIECMACDQANYPGSQTIYLTHHTLGSKFPIPDELPGISVGPFKSIDEFAEDSRRG